MKVFRKLRFNEFSQVVSNSKMLQPLVNVLAIFKNDDYSLVPYCQISAIVFFLSVLTGRLKQMP